MATFPAVFGPGSPNKNRSESQNHKRVMEDSHRGGKRREARILPVSRLVNPLMANGVSGGVWGTAGPPGSAACQGACARSRLGLKVGINQKVTGHSRA